MRIDHLDNASEMRWRYEERKAEAMAALGGACVWCGADDRLEFDHIDPATKVKAVTQLAKATPAKFWAEVAKCQLLCEPCHQTKTTAEQTRWRHGTAAGYSRHRCRCDPCRAAYSVYRRARYLRLHDGAKTRPRALPAPDTALG